MGNIEIATPIHSLKGEILSAAAGLGFAAAGVTTAEPVDGRALFAAIDEGRIRDMAWLARDPKKRCDPASLLPGARSVICCALVYGEEGISTKGSSPRPRWIARFARGAEYHAEVRMRLEKLSEALRACVPGARVRCCVDTSPLLEKALAQRAGLGWIGKHTVLLNERLGSWFVLGEVVTDVSLPLDVPALPRCGDCCACLDACPTKALIAPGVLDASRCLSYLTIEHRGEGPEEFRPFLIPDMVGCDLCQEACPYNATPRHT